MSFGGALAPPAPQPPTPVDLLAIVKNDLIIVCVAVSSENVLVIYQIYHRMVDSHSA